VGQSTILQDIDSLGLKLEVENAVEVLMRASMSTPRLHEVHRRGVDVYGIGTWSLFPLMWAGGAFIIGPLQHMSLRGICSGRFWWAPVLRLAMGFFGGARFALLDPDQRGFAAAAAGNITSISYLLYAFLVLLPGAIGGHERMMSSCDLDIMCVLLVGPLVLTLMVIGLEGVTDIPSIGPAIVNLLLPSERGLRNKLARCFRCHTSLVDSDGSSSSENSVLSEDSD